MTRWSRAAERYGLQVAQRILDQGTALACLTAAARALLHPDTPMDFVAAVLDQWIARAEDLRLVTEGRIASRARAMRQAEAPDERIEAEAHASNAAAGAPLLTYEVRALVQPARPKARPRRAPRDDHAPLNEDEARLRRLIAEAERQLAKGRRP